ncbi:MAG: hypothetical protein EBU74_09690 [Betaproteobacteria bacterium]|nr:hypothetical protein [Betaproteobacteria bacterium]
MQAAAPRVLALFLTAAAAPAWPHSCPLEMYKIDQALSTSKNLDPALIRKVRDLRAEGEKLHKQDKHGEAMLVLGSAKKLLKIE